MGWKDGRRVVDLCELAKQMYCQKCKSILDLNRTGEEIQVGLASVLIIACFCGSQNRVRTTQRQRSDSGEAFYDYTINIQTATCIEKTNISIRKLNKFFTDLHIHGFPASRKQMSVFMSTADTSLQPSSSTNPCITCTATTVYPRCSQQASANLHSVDEPAPTTEHSSFQPDAGLGDEGKQNVPEEQLATGQFPKQPDFDDTEDEENKQFPDQHELDILEGGEIQNIPDERHITRQFSDKLELNVKYAEDKQMKRPSLPAAQVDGNIQDVAGDKGKEDDDLINSIVPESRGSTVVGPCNTTNHEGKHGAAVQDKHGSGDHVYEGSDEDMANVKYPRPKLFEAVVILEQLQEPISSFQVGEASQQPGPSQTAHQGEKAGENYDSVHSNSPAFITSEVPSSGKEAQKTDLTAAGLTGKPKCKKLQSEAMVTQKVDRPYNPFYCEACDFHFYSLMGLFHHQLKKHGADFARVQKELLLKRGPQDLRIRHVETDKRTGFVEARQMGVCSTSSGEHGDKTSKILCVTGNNENLDKRKNDCTQSTNNTTAIMDTVLNTAETSQGIAEDSHVLEDSVCKEAHDYDLEIKDDVGVRLSSHVSNSCKMKLKVFKCGWCSAEFWLKSMLKAHMVKHTKLNSCICDICGKRFNHVASMNRHKQRHIGKVMHTCENCSKTFQTLRLLKHHKKTVHGRDKRTTENEPQTTETGSEADVPLQFVDQSVSEQKVDVQKEVGNSAEDCSVTNLFPHTDCSISGSETCQPRTQELNEKFTYKCKVCSASFPCRRSFGQHMLHTHPDVEDIYSCTHCDITFKYGRDYNDHLVNVHFIYPFHCQECGAQFKYLTLLREHGYKHQGLRPFMCDTCGKTYPRVSQLRRHELSHLGERVYGCKVCGKRFLQLFHLVQHQRTHTGERPFVCEKCGKAYSQPSTLHNHMRTHGLVFVQQAKIECKDCGKLLANNKRYLAEHQAVCKKVYVKRYGDYRDFVCEKCGKDCKRRQGIHHHKKVGCQGPFQATELEDLVETNTDSTFCKKCQKHFSSPQHLLHHLCNTCGKTKVVIVDRNSPGYTLCKHCGAEFSTLRSCQYHMYTHCVERRKRLAEVTPPDPDSPGYCVCRHCGKAFASKSRRKYHVMRQCPQRTEVKKCRVRKKNENKNREGSKEEGEGMKKDEEKVMAAVEMIAQNVEIDMPSLSQFSC